MIELLTSRTPNGHKVTLFLEEAGLPYRVHPVNIGKDDQFKPEFLAISPNNKTPALVDPDGPGGKPHAVFETSAMLRSASARRKLPHQARGAAHVSQGISVPVGFPSKNHLI